MNRSTVTTTERRLAALAVFGLALLLQGCNAVCYDSSHSCFKTMPEAGIYSVRYLRFTDGLNLNITVATFGGGVLQVCDCEQILEATLIVKDLPPDCTHASDTVHTLWPPNQDFVNIPIEGVTDPDGNTIFIQVEDHNLQDESSSGLFPGDLSPDVRKTSTSTAEVRAERDPNGNGRVYRIYFTASDGQGAICLGQERVCVPLLEGGTCVEDRGETNLRITGSDAPDPVNQGDLLNYTMDISEVQAVRASSVVLTDTLPPSVIFVSAEIDGNPQRCAESHGVVTCTLGDIERESPKTAKITVRPTSAGIITNTASVRALEKDTDQNNNTLTQTTTVNPPDRSADATVSIAAAPNPGQVNNELKFTIVLQNLDPQTAATGVTMSGFNLQPIGRLVAVEFTQGSCLTAPGGLSCNVGTLAGGGSATLTIRATPSSSGKFTETVTVTSNNDRNSANNTASVEVTVNPP